MQDIYQQLFGVHGQRAVVTGGARGLGREISQVLAAAGAQVVIVDIDDDAARQTAAAIVAQGHQARACCADLCDEAQLQQCLTEVIATHGGIDILINNAGNYPKYDFLSVTREQWESVHQLNLRASFLCMQIAIRDMLARGRGGRIVNISSVAAVHPATHANTHYAAAKAGLNALTRGAALEYSGHGITINTVMPGAIAGDTAATSNAAPSVAVTGPAADRSRWLAGRAGTAREVAAAVLFLVGPGGAYTSGQALAVDGGFLIS